MAELYSSLAYVSVGVGESPAPRLALSILQILNMS